MKVWGYDMGTEINVSEVKDLATKLRDNMGQVVLGKTGVIDKIIIALFSGGHILLEDIPGTGKTTLAKALSCSINCEFKRVQFTPDLLPSDLIGVNFYNQKQGEFVFKQGAVFTNILLADEINRATPRTQSSLLECMEEKQASVDGYTYKLDSPFLVIATQNPIETQGTFPLPEAQIDRFFMQLSLGYPDFSSEVSMLSSQAKEHPLKNLQSVANKQEIVTAMKIIDNILVSDEVMQYIVNIITATRTHDKIQLGVSPRGTLALMRGAKTHAGINGRDFVLPDDVKAVAVDILSHRIMCKGYSMSSSIKNSADIIAQILHTTQVPV